MEILQVIAGPFVSSGLAPNLIVMPALATAMDSRKILEEQPRATQQCRRRSVVIGREGIDAGLDIGEILSQQGGHVRVKPAAFGPRRIRMWLRPLAGLLLLSPLR